MLVVDLDNTLLRSDLLYESFWSAFGRSWLSPFVSVWELGRGKAALKDYLCSVSDVDVETLPYDENVLAYIRSHRDQGGRVALVTASNQVFAERVANHLGVFEEVFGSDRTHNLKGTGKAAFLVDRFGEENFSYMGDAYADLPVWEAAARIVTVNAPHHLRRKAEAIGKPIEHLGTAKKSPNLYVKALRPYQWIKNILVFLPMLAAHQFDTPTLVRGILAFLVFCTVASSVYVLNDLLDLGPDRAHPRKRLRPLASGNLPIAHGGVLAAALLFAGVLGAISLGWMFLLVLAGYYILTVAYSLNLKRRIVVDICALAGLYTLRIIVGAVATNIELSVWLLAFSIFFFLSLAAVKRQAELVDMVERGTLKAKGRGYHVADLPVISMIGLAAGYISVLVLALYVNSPAVVELYAYPHALWGICCILLYWLTRMVLITHRGAMHDDPIIFAASDRVSQICLAAMVAFGVAGAVL